MPVFRLDFIDCNFHLTISYAMPTSPRELRRERLSKYYYFNCQCKRCMDDEEELLERSGRSICCPDGAVLPRENWGFFCSGQFLKCNNCGQRSSITLEQVCTFNWKGNWDFLRSTLPMKSWPYSVKWTLERRSSQMMRDDLFDSWCLRFHIILYNVGTGNLNFLIYIVPRGIHKLSWRRRRRERFIREKEEIYRYWRGEKNLMLEKVFVSSRV